MAVIEAKKMPGYSEHLKTVKEQMDRHKARKLFAQREFKTLSAAEKDLLLQQVAQRLGLVKGDVP